MLSARVKFAVIRVVEGASGTTSQQSVGRARLTTRELKARRVDGAQHSSKSSEWSRSFENTDTDLLGPGHHCMPPHIGSAEKDIH